MPTQANKDLIVNWYYKYFRDARLVALQEGSGYPNTLGAGWRGDCFGDYNYFSPTWSHMANVYPVIAAKPEVVNNWKRSPVEFEACGVMQDWYNKGVDIDLVLQRGLDWHMSVFNGKTSPVPAAWRPKVDAWLKKIGYRFVLNSVTHGGHVHRACDRSARHVLAGRCSLARRRKRSVRAVGNCEHTFRPMAPDFAGASRDDFRGGFCRR
jgi:hypothetical protein